MTEVSIYALKDPRTDAIRYVGQARYPDIRYRDHCTGPGPSRDFSQWKLDLRALGLVPIMVILEVTTTEHADDREWHWIQWALTNGCSLLNKQGYKRAWIKRLLP